MLMIMRIATVVQVLQDLFKFYCMFYFTCDRSFSGDVDAISRSNDSRHSLAHVHFARLRHGIGTKIVQGIRSVLVRACHLHAI